MRRVKKQTDTPMKNWRRSLWEYKCWKKRDGPHFDSWVWPRRKDAWAARRQMKGVSQRDASFERHLPRHIKRVMVCGEWASCRAVQTRFRLEEDEREGWDEEQGRSWGINTGQWKHCRLETERQWETMKEEHRGAGDKDGETLRIGTQESLPWLDTPAKVSGRDIE